LFACQAIRPKPAQAKRGWFVQIDDYLKVLCLLRPLHLSRLPRLQLVVRFPSFIFHFKSSFDGPFSASQSLYLSPFCINPNLPKHLPRSLLSSLAPPLPSLPPTHRLFKQSDLTTKCNCGPDPFPTLPSTETIRLLTPALPQLLHLLPLHHLFLLHSSHLLHLPTANHHEFFISFSKSGHLLH
jgi:hypothetical protein